MYLATVRFTAKPGKSNEVAAAAIGLSETIERINGQPSRAWVVLGGDDVGSYAVTARVDSMAQFTDNIQRINADPGHLEQSAATSGLVVGPAEIDLHRIEHASEGFSSRPLMTATRAVIAPGQVSAATAWCAEMTDFIAKTAGVGAGFVSNAAGRFGGIGIAAAFEDGDDFDAAHGRLVADPGYLERLDAGGPLFEAGSSSTTLLAQIR